MANWAKLQEQLTGLPVAKRAKYGIHFDKGGGEILAEFVGKPCHYLDGGIWKPIDTALLATADGWFSSPHSDVIIHPDGRVKVKNSNYQQFTKLPSAKAGKLAGDRVIRTFPGGEQHLIMKEDGFREEIHVNKQKIPVEKFIAKTMGNLPSKYTAHPITAEDAEGNLYEFTGDVKAFGAWLDKAVYPVVIDPDFSSSSTYGSVRGANANFLVAQATATDVYTNLLINGADAADLRVYRAFLQFDTSSIGSGSVVNQANLKMAFSTVDSSPGYDHQIVKLNWSGQSPLSSANKEVAYDACLSADADDNILVNSAGKSIDTYYTSGNLSTAWISKDGVTYYGLRASNDYGKTDWTRGTRRDIFYPPGHATYPPVLMVLYSAGGVPRHFMHYQRMRSL